MKVGTNKYKWQSLLVKPIAIGLLAGFVSLFTSSSAYAVCVTEDGAEILHLGGRNMIVFWVESECNSIPDALMYQTSSNNGQTWSVEGILVTSTQLGGTIGDFDAVLLMGKRGRLAATFNVIEGVNPKLKVVTSNNFGRDWGPPHPCLEYFV